MSAGERDVTAVDPVTLVSMHRESRAFRMARGAGGEAATAGMIEKQRLAAEAHGMRAIGTTDVLLFREGPPVHPWQSKLGGIPHVPVSFDWPLSRTGRPLTFGLQLHVGASVESLAINADALPGDLLLLFLDAEKYWDLAPEQPADWTAHWSNKDPEEPLLASSPDQYQPFPILHGVRCRVPLWAWEESEERLAPAEWDAVSSLFGEEWPNRIGGRPSFLAADDDSVGASDVFLGSFRHALAGGENTVELPMVTSLFVRPDGMVAVVEHQF